ncbi:MAG: sodium-dependent bicarbonate transport family permease [Phycisphaerales bacterium]|nr:sodium-dependent bicarbonate transport family permease [Phycisphaerales bacterium]
MINAAPLLDNLLSPPILFFFLGMLATLVRSDLEFPRELAKLFSLYLLWAIGFKGGVAIRASGLTAETLQPLVMAVILSAVIPLYVVPLLKLARFQTADACAAAGTFGSVSVVTFITAQKFLESQNIEFGGHLVAALALMEAPAIITAVMLYRAMDSGSSAQSLFRGRRRELAHLLHEAAVSGPVFLLLGSIAVGAMTGDKGWQALQPFSQDLFDGVLVLFLLDSGITASRQLRQITGSKRVATLVSCLIPLINAAIALVVVWALDMPRADGFLFMILSASASYIAAPAAMKLAIPNANSGLYVPMALGLTFPFNITVGIPLYYAAAGWVTG